MNKQTCPIVKLVQLIWRTGVSTVSIVKIVMEVQVAEA